MKVKVRAKTHSKKVLKANPPYKPDPLTRAKELIDTIESSWFEFSLIAVEIYENELYKPKYERLSDYTKEELGIDYRVFMMKVHMGTVIREKGIKRESVAEIGWTKFKEVAALLEEDLSATEVERLLGRVKDMTFRETQEFVKRERIKRTGGEETKIVTLKFKLTDEQADTVNYTLELAQKVFETDSPNIALECVCMEWQMKHDPSISQTILSKTHQDNSPTRVKQRKRVDKKVGK